MKTKKILLIITILLITLISISISNEQNSILTSHLIKEKPIGTLLIKKINLKENFYNKNSNENTIEKHITILKETIFPNKKNSLVLIAAHSGTGKIAYFEELDQLAKNDIINIIYQNKKYTYIVKDIWEEKKNGYININREEKPQLVLTTCSPNKEGYQLIVNCTQKESNHD